MSEPLNCPRCDGILTDSEVRILHKRYASAQRKTKSGGKNGGRRKADPWIENAFGVAQPMPDPAPAPAVREAQVFSERTYEPMEEY